MDETRTAPHSAATRPEEALPDDAFELVGAGWREHRPALRRPGWRQRLARLPLLPLCLLLLLVLGCLCAPWLANHDPAEFYLADRNTPPGSRFFFGTDSLGRDIYSIIWFGGRASLLIGLLSAAVITVLGVAYGCLSGIAPARTDALLMRLVELVQSIPVLLVLLLAALGAFGAAAETTVGMSGAGSFKMEQVYVNVPELDVYFYALDGDGNSYSPIKVQAAGPELTLGDRRLEVRSVAAASDPICYILALDNSKSIAPSEFYTMLGGVRKLINAMGDDDQLMLYTPAGSTECVLPATSDKNLMYKTLGSIKQVEGSMDTARLISAVYSELQSDYQALAPRKAAMIVTDAGQVLTNMTLFATLASDVSDQIGMAAYIYLMTDRPGAFETLESAADGRLVLCEASTLGDELKKKQEYLATALEIKTEVPESLYGERLETLTLAMPQLGSAIRSSQTVYMGYRLAKPQVTKVETLRRDKLRLTFNQPINENANKPQLYEVRSKDIWNWRV